MERNDIYRLRRAILAAVEEYAGPVSLDDVLRHPVFLDSGVGADAALDQWCLLIANGYLDALPASDGRYVRLTPNGRRQLSGTKEGRAVFLWGAHAL